jgi:3',5'-cyclic-AMP phosphodiesterase
MPDPLLRFVHISDTHIHADPEYTRSGATNPPYDGAIALVEQINNLPFAPDFVLHTGDVAYDPDPEAYLICREILGEIAYPVHYLAGNHDDSAALQVHLLDRSEPLPGLRFEFEHNGVQVIGVDSNGPAEPPAGFMIDDELEWLAGLCQAQDERPLVIAVHHNMLPVGVPWLDDYMRTGNGERFHEAILPARQRIRGVFFGHVHQNLDILRDGILYSSTLSTWAQFHAWPGQTHTTSDLKAEPGFSVVTISREQAFIRRHRFLPPA